MTLGKRGELGTQVAITGVGMITPLGDDLSQVADALCRRERVVPSVTDGVHGDAFIANFDATRYLSVRGMRVYNRATQLGLSAARLALDSANLQESGPDLGVICGSSMAHLETLIEYDRSLITQGLSRTNPALMPLSIASAPGAAMALAFGAKAFSITLSAGSASSIDAIGLGTRLLASGRARACLVISAFTPCRALSLSASRAGLLADQPSMRAFDRRSRGTHFGEAAAALLLERVEEAQKRDVAPLGWVHAHASRFAPEPPDVEHALARACKAALASACTCAEELSLVSTGANGLPEADRAEARALLLALETKPQSPVVSAIKSNFGETFDASGLLQTLLALHALRTGMAPPIANLEEPSVPGLRYAMSPAPLHTGTALISASSHTGACSALVLSSAS